MAPTGEPAWTLTRQALERLLARLGPDSDAAAREYEVIRRRLIEFFDGRGSSCPDSLADQTIDRVARRLDEGERVDSLRAYFFGVARRVLFEWAKRKPREAAVRQVLAWEVGNGPAADLERRVACLERCLAELPSETQLLILEYYETKGLSHLKARKLLARRLDITYGALKTRAHRARLQLEECLRRRLDSPESGDQ